MSKKILDGRSLTFILVFSILFGMMFSITLNRTKYSIVPITVAGPGGSSDEYWNGSGTNDTIWSNSSYTHVHINGDLNVSGDILPFVTLLQNIGSGPLRWEWLYVANISADKIDVSGDITADDINGDDITSSGKFFGNASNVTGREGYYGLNSETLGAGKTLTAYTDTIYQHLNPNGVNRDVTLATAGAKKGNTFIIFNSADYTIAYYLQIKQGASSLDRVYAQGVKKYVFDGTNWVHDTVGSSGKTNVYNTALGWNAQVYNAGVAIGGSAAGYGGGVAIGNAASGYTYGVGIGNSANGRNYGVAVGSSANTGNMYYSIALGYGTLSARYAELSYNIAGADTDSENNILMVGWAGDTTTAAVTEIFCGGVTNKRCDVRAKSVLAFDIVVTGMNSTYTDTAMYKFHGMIKRNNSGDTLMVLCNKSVIYETVSAWDCNVTADDANDALIIKVTGEASHTIQWVARLDGVETHF